MDSIFDALVALAATVITCYLIPLLRSKTTVAQQAQIDTLVDMAVAAAEQMFDSDQGAEKLNYVTEFLAQRGIEVVPEEIESAVYWLHKAVTTYE